MTEAAPTPPAAASARVAAEPQRTNWALVALLWLCGVAAGLQFAKASVAFDALAAHYGASPTLGPPLFAASMAGMGPHGLLVPALALSAGGAAIALWAERRAASVHSQGGAFKG